MMRLFIWFCLIISLVSLSLGQTFYGSTVLKTFRDGRDKEFRDREQSPLFETDFERFAGLNYFPVRRVYRVSAVLRRTADEKYFLMPTSSGTPKRFRKFGVLAFRIAGRVLRLSVYRADAGVLQKFPEYADLLFIPFRDRTTGTETYGGGRYIDIKTPKGGSVIMDFNLAYNPSCAYGSDKYSCPIPPRENNLPLAIRAGEKKFAYSSH